jgi:hypothetical protein
MGPNRLRLDRIEINVQYIIIKQFHNSYKWSLSPMLHAHSASAFVLRIYKVWWRQVKEQEVYFFRKWPFSGWDDRVKASARAERL